MGKKILSLLLVLALAVCMLSSCGGGDVVAKYGSGKIDESDYAYLMAMVKGMFEKNFQTYYGLNLEDYYDESFTSDGKTVAEYMTAQVEDTAKLILVVEQLCKDAGISVDDPSVIASIDSAMQELEDQYGGADALNIELAKRGCNRDTLERYEYFQSLYQLLMDYRYGDNGVAKIAESDVKKAFEEQYVKFGVYQFALASYASDGSLSYFIHDFASDYKKSELKAFMNEQCMYCGYLTFEDEELANQALSDLQSGSKTPEDYEKEADESEATLVYLGKADQTIYKDLADKEPGTVLLEDADEGFVVLYKLVMNEDLFDDFEDQLRETKVSFDAEQFFSTDFRTVQHILYDDEDTAKQVLQDILDGKTTFEEHTSDSKDVNASTNEPSVEYTFSYGDMVEEFEKVSFGLEIGEYGIAPTEYGYHLIRRMELNTEAYNEETAITCMSRKYMLSKAEQFYADLQSGKIKFEDGTDDKEISYMEPALYEIANLSEELQTKIADAKVGELIYWKAGASGIMIFMKNELTDDDVKEKYDTVESTLVSTAYDDYLSGFFDEVTVVRSVADRFDIKTAKSLAS